MSAFIAPPTRIPLFLKAGIWISEKITGKPMLPARLLAWYPKAALGSAALEGLVAHHDGKIGKRMLKLVRLSASFATACPFCIDMNSAVYRETGISDAELASTAAQVNYWARLIHALGIPLAGLSDGCSVKPHRQAPEGH